MAVDNLVTDRLVKFHRVMAAGGLAMTTSAYLAKDFGGAAALLGDAGFDAVEVHLGHNYLPSAFLSPALNRRR